MLSRVGEENLILKRTLNKRLKLIRELNLNLENVFIKKNIDILNNFKLNSSCEKDKIFIFKEIVADFIKDSFLELKYIKYHSQFLNDPDINFNLKESFKILKRSISLTLKIETDYILTKKGLFVA